MGLDNVLKPTVGFPHEPSAGLGVPLSEGDSDLSFHASQSLAPMPKTCISVAVEAISGGLTEWRLVCRPPRAPPAVSFLASLPVTVTPACSRVGGLDVRDGNAILEQMSPNETSSPQFSAFSGEPRIQQCRVKH